MGAAKRPNVLFLFTDDQRFDTIHALGNPCIQTPNLDALAARGAVFRNAYIMGGTAPAVCMPSRAMLMTGRTLFRLEKQGQRIPEEHTTMPQHFRNAGYRTFHAGKWHQDGASHARSFTDGARIFGIRNKGWYETCNGHWHVPVCDFNPDGDYGPEDVYFANGPVEPFDPPYTKVREDGIHSSEIFSDDAVEFLKNRDRDDPFFMYVAYVAPHDPRQSPKRIHDMYPIGDIPLPENYLPEHPFDNGELRVRDELLEDFPRAPEAIKQHIADYYAIITHADEQIGRVLAALEETGEADNTIVVFSGDNGLAVGRHGLMGKQNMYDHSVHVPLIMAGPGVPQGEERDAWCYLLDIFPTLCDLADLDTPDSVEGRSLAPNLADPDAAGRDTLHFAYRECQRGVQRDERKLMEYIGEDGSRTTQLFDLANDPLEQTNLAERPEYAADLEQMRRELVVWRDELGDQGAETLAYACKEKFWDRVAL